ncbi:plasmid replication protein RepC [Sulfitobacter noctilucicola]|nr:plasmid replication protein RepC [Sulfitobacter noctilucicola]
MKHASQVSLGRPEAACRAHPNPQTDKWHLLDLLTSSAVDFDLSHRTLSVLKAMLTFLPTRDIPNGPEAVVFPSNATLSRRLSGMPESTLRRHLAKLVRSGIVSRHDSPNRKRYAKRMGQHVAIAFGFDLTPLRNLYTELTGRAHRIAAQNEALAVLRQEVLVLRNRVLEVNGPDPLIDEAAKVLRRKADKNDLMALREKLNQVVDNVDVPEVVAPEMSTSCAQNERHIQNSIKPFFDSEVRQQGLARKSIEPGREEISLKEVTSTCQSAQLYFPEPVKGWRDVIELSEKIGPMLGIDNQVLHQARQCMGMERAGVVVLCILERVGKIRSPGAYLRQLCKLAEHGKFSIAPMLKAVSREVIVS